jgi:hypothetical protein
MCSAALEDEGILGDSDFVLSVLSQAKREGCTLIDSVI